MRGFTYLQDRAWYIPNDGLIASLVGTDTPVDRKQAVTATAWLKQHFGRKFANATAGTSFAPHHLAAIVCQETATYWVWWLKTCTPEEVLARCVFDGCGDDPECTRPRKYFPVNTSEFRDRFGDDFTGMLIAEGNATRVLRKRGPVDWIYKGYGLFQFDLQYVRGEVEHGDEAYFRERRWRSIDICLEKVMSELKSKYAATRDLWQAIRAYNGSGPRAELYLKKVRKMHPWCVEAWR